MNTAGVDLSAQDTNTALCTIEWDSRRARVARLRVGCTDGEILTVLRCAGRSGIIHLARPDSLAHLLG
jgi:hypothetical protein